MDPSTARQPCTCIDETWCPACTAFRAAKRPWNSGTPPERYAAQKRYYARNREKYRAYAKHYNATHRPPRQEAGFSPLPKALVAAALREILPERWHHADVFGPGPYLWHCQAWQKIEQLPHVCPGCGMGFLTPAEED